MSKKMCKTFKFKPCKNRKSKRHLCKKESQLQDKGKESSNINDLTHKIYLAWKEVNSGNNSGSKF